MMATSELWRLSIHSDRIRCDGNTIIFRGLFILGIILISTLPSLSEALPLTVTPSVASPGQTITVTGSGFQPGTRGTVWGVGHFFKEEWILPSVLETISTFLMGMFLWLKKQSADGHQHSNYSYGSGQRDPIYDKFFNALRNT